DGSTAVDYTVKCATGFPYLTGTAGAGTPVNHVLPAWDMACAFHASFSLTAALLRRSAGGPGAELRLALSDVAFAMLSHLGLSTEAEILQQERAPIGNYLYGAFGLDFATADGHRIYLAGVSLNQWKALVRACDMVAAMALLADRLGLDFDEEAQRFAAREAIAGLLAPWIGAHTLAQLEQVFTLHGACWGQYRTVRQAVQEDVRLSSANPMFSSIDTAGVGRHLAAGAPVRLMGEQRQATLPAPRLGADTDAVLQDVLGLDGGTLGRLHDGGIIAGPDHASPWA
ncbi:MAG: CoA transferase, partial [Janthinobacterium lividum]